MLEQKEELKPGFVVANGNGQPYPTPRSRLRDETWGRLSENLLIGFLTMCLFVYSLVSHRGVALTVIVLLIILSFVMYKLAIKYAVSAELSEKAVARDERVRTAELRYQVSEARLLTLKAEGVPNDVISALTKLLREQPPLQEEKFLEKIALDPITDLGWERTLQWKEKILKYTKLDRKMEVIPAKKIAATPNAHFQNA